MSVPEAARSPWAAALVRLGLAWAALAALTAADWREMAHQWWDIDTYNHVLLVPVIVAWLIWLRRDEIGKVQPSGSLPGLAWLAGGLSLWLIGREADLNIVAQTGAVTSMQGAVVTVIGLRASLVLLLPLLYSSFLVPFGDELIPFLQQLTADMTIALTHASGVPAVIDGLFIDTPAGKFVVAEECSGVKFLVAMTALAVLVAWTGFTSWQRRAMLIVGAAIVSILANAVRAWGTIYLAQYIGIERAGGFDHLVYGWIFFAVVIALVLGCAWRWIERDPEEAGLTAAEASAHPLTRFDHALDPITGSIAIVATAIGFAALAAVV